MSELDSDLESYEMTPEAIKFGDDLTVAMARDIVEQVEEQKKRLLLKIAQLTEQLEAQKKEQSDIYYYLNKKLDDNFETISSLEEQLLNEQSDREVSERMFERTIEELNSKLSGEEARFQSKINSLELKIESLNEFDEKKHLIEAELARANELIVIERGKHASIIDDIEMRKIKESNILEKNLVAQVEIIKQSYLAKVESSLDEETRSIRLENLRLKSEMKLQSLEADKVREISKSILEKDRELRNEYQLAQSNEKELVNRLGTYQHLIKQLNERNLELEDKNGKLQTQIEALTALGASVPKNIAATENFSINSPGGGSKKLFPPKVITKLFIRKQLLRRHHNNYVLSG